MDIYDENDDHADIGLLYEEQMGTYEIPDETPSFSDNPTGEATPPREINMEYMDALKEAELNLSDELAEMDYEGNPDGVLLFMKQLTQAIVKFNNPQQ